jgi:putative peptidoglycan lipid II flippase
MLPVIIGSSAYQINILIGTLLGSLLPEGSISYLYFADRLVQFPLGLFAVAASIAVLPTLSRQAAARDYRELKTTFARALKLVFFVTIPAMIGLMVLCEPIVALLFQRGEFDAVATQLTSLAVLYYSTGIWAFSAVKMVTATFFALQDTRTPVLMALISIAANVLLGLVLMKPLAHGGLALAASLASILNLILLVAALRARLGFLGWRKISRSAARAFLTSMAMGCVVWAASRLLIPPTIDSFGQHLAGVAMSVSIGIGVYALISYLIKSPEYSSIKTEIMKGASEK